MSEKKNQHYVPKVFLKAFCDPERPPALSPSVPYTPAVWMIPKSLRGRPKQRAPVNVFKAKRAYNLSTDDPEEPFLENALSKLEGLYDKLLSRLARFEELSVEDYTTVVMFIAALNIRNLENLDHWQAQFDELERLHRITERAHTGLERASNEIFWMGTDTSMLLLPTLTRTYTEVVISTGWFLINRTGVPYITSDTPTVHTFVHPDELEYMGFAKDIIASGAHRSERSFLCYCALRPDLAFVSSPLLIRPENTTYREPNNPSQVFMLNELMRRNASGLIVSSQPVPFGSLTNRLADRDDLLAEQLQVAKTQSGIHIYTETERCWIPVSFLSIEDGNNPLSTRITFRTDSIDLLRALPSAERITQLTTFQPERGGTMLRDAHFLQLAITPSGETVIEWDP